jgi:Tfp pilus assembly protein PilN
VIRTNLATRPFYNEAAVRLVLAIVAILVAAATLVNGYRLVQFSKSDTTLAVEATRDEARAVELRAEATQLRASVDMSQVESASVDAREANDLIDRRTFSWTELFNRFESTLPDQVRITSLRHSLDRDRGIVLAITVLANEVDDVNQFMENLARTKAFRNLLIRNELTDPDTGQLEVSLEAEYVPSGVPSDAAAPATPSPSTRSSTPAATPSTTAASPSVPPATASTPRAAPSTPTAPAIPPTALPRPSVERSR